VPAQGRGGRHRCRFRAGDGHAAVLPFHRVQSAIGETQQSLHGHAVVGIDGDAKADPQPRFFNVAGKARADAAANQRSPSQPGFGQHDRKFIPPAAGRSVQGSTGTAQRRRNAAERAVPRLVSAAIIDPLQAIKVEQKNAERPARPLRTTSLGFERMSELTEVGKPRQRVRSRQALKVSLTFPVGGDVIDDELATGRCCIPDTPAAEPHDERRAALSPPLRVSCGDLAGAAIR
jgi:hypothetical protein